MRQGATGLENELEELETSAGKVTCESYLRRRLSTKYKKGFINRYVTLYPSGINGVSK